jgi:hypothetical protein
MKGQIATKILRLTGGNLAGKLVADALNRGVEPLLVEIVDHDVVAAERNHMGYAATHLTRADNSDLANWLHLKLLLRCRTGVDIRVLNLIVHRRSS